jgi:hypothetical protein
MNLVKDLRAKRKAAWAEYCLKARSVELLQQALKGVEGQEYLKLWFASDYGYEDSIRVHLVCPDAPSPADVASAVVTRLANTSLFTMDKQERTLERRGLGNHWSPFVVNTEVEVQLTLPPERHSGLYRRHLTVVLSQLGPPPACTIETVEEEVEEAVVAAHTEVKGILVTCTDPVTGETRQEMIQ